MATVLSRTGPGRPTSGEEEAARLLKDYGWSESKWKNLSSQLVKLLRFCDEDDRCPLPANEGDVLAFVGYLSLKNLINGHSLPQYIGYHVLHSLPSPTLTPLVRALPTAYVYRDSESTAGRDHRIGMSAVIVKQVLEYGLHATNADQVCAAAMVVFAFVFQVRSVTVDAVRP